MSKFEFPFFFLIDKPTEDILEKGCFKGNPKHRRNIHESPKDETKFEFLMSHYLKGQTMFGCKIQKTDVSKFEYKFYMPHNSHFPIKRGMYLYVLLPT